MTIQRLATFSIFSLFNLDTEANNSMIVLTDLMMEYFLRGVKLNLLFILMLLLKLINLTFYQN